MTKYVEHVEANEQINLIASLLAKGHSDQAVADQLMAGRHSNLASADGGALIFGFLIWMWRATGTRKNLPTATTTKAASLEIPTVEPPKIVPTDQNATATPRDEHWAQALTELQSSARKPGLWARAYAEAQGDESRAQANYLSARSRQLVQEEVESKLKKQQAAEQDEAL
jgi:hypothetical protein